MQGLGLGVEGAGLKVQGSEFMVLGCSRFRVEGLVLSAEDSGFRVHVYGSRLRIEG